MRMPLLQKCGHGVEHSGGKIFLLNLLKDIQNGQLRWGLTHPLSRVVDPSQFTPSGMGERAGMPSGDRTATATMDMVARDNGENYAPFRADAAAPAPKIREEAPGGERQELTPEQFWKRASSMLDKLNKALTPKLLQALDEQPESVKERMRDALTDIREKVEGSLD
jgi:hypothetical protein